MRFCLTHAALQRAALHPCRKHLKGAGLQTGVQPVRPPQTSVSQLRRPENRAARCRRALPDGDTGEARFQTCDDADFDSLSAYSRIGQLNEGPEGPGLLDADVWASKPPWCQPWSILLTGAIAVVVVWQFSGGSLLASTLVAVPVAVWWYLFLLVMPQSYRQYVEEVASQAQR